MPRGGSGHRQDALRDVNSVAIAGVGLIGGSFALALRKAGFKGEIAGISSPATIAKAKGVIDRGITIQEAAGYDLVFLAQPIRQIIETLPNLAGSTALITDAGSTKRAICAAAKDLQNFIGGHPMAGKEVRGVENSDADLFRGRPWLLTGEPPAWFRETLERIGANIMMTTPEQHDQMIAMASHMPQLVSCAIAKVTKPVRHVGGPGLESMTRISRSSYDIWRDILDTNRDEAIAALDHLISEATFLRQAVLTEDPAVEEYFNDR